MKPAPKPQFRIIVKKSPLWPELWGGKPGPVKLTKQQGRAMAKHFRGDRASILAGRPQRIYATFGQFCHATTHNSLEQKGFIAYYRGSYYININLDKRHTDAVDAALDAYGHGTK